MSDKADHSKHLTNSRGGGPSVMARQREIASLEQRLTPATAGEIEDRLAALFAQFNTGVSGDADRRIEGYVLALHGICLEALDDSVRAILKGETECHPDFMPSAPRLAQICRRFQGYEERALRRARNMQAQFDGPGYYLEDWMERGDGAEHIGEIAMKLIGQRPSKRDAA